MEKLMILGGSENQLPLIKSAKKLGHNVIVCDYSNDNIGKELADIFYQVSTLDKEAVLKVAVDEQIDGVVTNSEPAMPVSAYVGNKLGLPSNPYESVVTLSNKVLFRNFLKINQFKYPKSYNATDYKEALNNIINFNYPLMVKPIDSSGSRGVSKITSPDELKSAFYNAVSFSKSKHVIIEEFIENSNDYIIGGDIFVQDGEVGFWGLMNCHRDTNVNSFVPIGKSYPSFITSEEFIIIKETINSLLKILNIKFGAFNVEMMFSNDGRLFIIEMNPRNGGNRISELLRAATGVDIMKATIQASLDFNNVNLSNNKKNKFMASYNLHSEVKGILKDVTYNMEIKNNIFETYKYIRLGEKVERFNSADKLVGINFIEFDSANEMKYTMDNIKDFITLEID